VCWDYFTTTGGKVSACITFAIVSLDVCAVSQEFCRGVNQEIVRKSGIAAENIRIGATHTHSMPTLRHFRQWGRLPEDYRDMVAKRIVEAVELARKDLSPAKLFLGKERVAGASHNRTSEKYKTDERFTQDSTDDDRWLDRTLHALYFARPGPGRIIHFDQRRPGTFQSLRRRGSSAGRHGSACQIF